MPISVIHIKNAPAGWKTDPRYVYIGRPSRWGNPFRMKGEHTRAHVINAFAGMMLRRVMKEDDFLGKLREDLRDKVLVCYCAPLPCHGDVLKSMVEDLVVVDGKASLEKPTK